MHSFATITDNSTMLKISDTQFCMVITKHINGHITALLFVFQSVYLRWSCHLYL